MKKIVPLLLAAALCLALAACGEPGNCELGAEQLAGGNYPEAVAFYTAAIDEQEDLETAYPGRAAALAAQGLWQEAINDYEALVALAPDAAAYGALSDCYMAMGNRAGAQEARARGYAATGDESLAPLSDENFVPTAANMAGTYYGYVYRRDTAGGTACSRERYVLYPDGTLNRLAFTGGQWVEGVGGTYTLEGRSLRTEEPEGERVVRGDYTVTYGQDGPRFGETDGTSRWKEFFLDEAACETAMAARMAG